MKAPTRKTWALVAVGTVIVIAAAVLALRWAANRPEPKANPASPAVETVARRSFIRTAPWIGTVESAGAVRITALAEGRVLKVDARDAARVKAGTLLFTLGGPVLGPSLKAAGAAVRTWRARLELARQVAARKKRAAKTRVVNRNEAASAQQAVERARNGLADARKRLRSLRAQSELRAPVAGVFSDRRVNPGQDVAAGEVLADVVDPHRLRVAGVVYVPSGTCLLGRSAEVEAGGRLLHATIARVFPDRTPGGGVKFWLEGKGLADRLAPGESARGRIEYSRSGSAPAVPRSALVYDEHEQPYVFVKTGGGYRKTRVKTGAASARWVEIVKGVSPGDQVVVRGAYELFYAGFSKTYKVED